MRYRNAAPHGGGAVSALLPFYRARADRLPRGIDALVCASDLQGRLAGDPWGGPERLLGEGVAEALGELMDERAIPSTVGALLAGDLYAVPGAVKRGGFGCVRAVYDAFASQCAWVIGVAGNHDDVSNVTDALGEGCALLDGDVVSAGDLRVGGVSWVCGNPHKPGKREESEQLAHVELVCESAVDVLLLHEGPSHPAVAERIVRARVGLTVYGHRANPVALTELAPGVQALNVHERVVIVTL